MKRTTRRFQWRISGAIQQRISAYQSKGLAHLRHTILRGGGGGGANRLRTNPSGLGKLIPIAEVVKKVEDEISSGKKLPGDDWFRAYEKWKSTPAKQRSKTAPGELSEEDQKKFVKEYVGVLIADLKEYVPFIFDVVFSRREQKPGDVGESVWLLYQYGCRQISRLMPGFAKIVKKVISNEVDLVGNWNEEISPEALNKALGKEEKKGGKKAKPPSYAPKKEIVEICTVTHRQLEETLKKDLGLIAQALWPPKAGRAVSEEIIQPLSGLPSELFPADVMRRIGSLAQSRTNMAKPVDVNRLIKKGGIGGALIGGLVKIGQAVKAVPLQRSVNYPGGDYRNLKVRTVVDCQLACAREPRCKAFTYERRGRKCFLKDRVTRQARDRNYDSGVKRSGARSSLSPLGRRARVAACATRRPARRRPTRRVARRPARPRAATILVLSADYGKNCRARAGNYTAHVRRSCNGKTSCSYRVTFAPNRNRDPAPNCSKAFEVSYRCGLSGRPQSASIPAEAMGKTAALACAAGAASAAKRRNPLKAFGRSLGNTMKRHGGSVEAVKAAARAQAMKIRIIKASLGHNCEGKRAGNWTQKVKTACEGKTRCDYRTPPQQCTLCTCTWAIAIEYHCGDDIKKVVERPGWAWHQPPANLDCTQARARAQAQVADAVRVFQYTKGRTIPSPHQRRISALLYKDMGKVMPSLKGETYHDVAKRLLTFYRKTGSARNFELAVTATKKNDSVQTLANNVQKQAPEPAKKGGDLADATKKTTVDTRTRRELLRRKVEQWTYGYEYNQLKPVFSGKGQGLRSEYTQAEQQVLKEFWSDCEELRAVCENPRAPSEKHRCVECAKVAMYTHCVDGKEKGGKCRGQTSIQLIDLERAVNGLETKGNWKEYASKIGNKDWPNGNTFLNWLELKLIGEAFNPNVIRGDDGANPAKLKELAARHLVARIFLAHEVDEEKGLSNEGRQQLDSLPVSSWQRCVLFNPQYTAGSTVCDRGDTSIDRFKSSRDAIPWHNALLFKTALEGSGVRQYFQSVADFWRKRCSNPQWRGHCANWAKLGRDRAKQVFASAKGKDGSFDRDKQMQDAGDSMGNVLGPVVGKLLGLLLKAAGMYETMKTLARAAGLTPEQSVDCEDPEYRHDVLQIKSCNVKMGDKPPPTCMDHKRGCLLKVFAKNFVNVLESIIIMLGNKLVDWGVDLIRTLLQPVKSAIIASAGSVPFVGGVLATIVDIAWELLMNFGAKMLLKSFVIAKLPEWLKIRELSKQPIDKLFEEPIVAVVMGIILQIIQSAVDYGDKSVANVASATVLSLIQEALLRVKPTPNFWIKALMYAKREFAKDDITSDNPLDIGFEIAIRMLKGFKAAMMRRLTGDSATQFSTKVDELIAEVDTPSKRQEIANRLTQDPVKELTRLVGTKVGPIVVPIVTSFVNMPTWAKEMVNKFGENLSKTIEEFAPPPGRSPVPVDGLKIFGRVVDVLKPAGKALLDALKVDADLKSVLIDAYERLTGALGESRIGRLKADYLDKPWEIVKAVVEVSGEFIKTKLSDLIRDPNLTPEKNLIRNTLDLVFEVLTNETKRNRIFGSGFNFSELLKEIARPLRTYATERMVKLTAGTGLEGLGMLLVTEVFGEDGPFAKGEAYFTPANLLRRLEVRGPQIAGHALDAVVGIINEKGIGGPILGSLVSGVAIVAKKVLGNPRLLQSTDGVLGLVRDGFAPLAAQRQLIVGFVRSATRSEPIATALDRVFGELAALVSDPAQLRALVTRGASQAFNQLMTKTKDLLGKLIDALVADRDLGKLAKDGFDAVLGFVTQAVSGGGRNLANAAKGILEKALPALVDFGKAKLMRLIPDSLKPIRDLTGKWFDRLKTMVRDLVRDPAATWRRLTTGGGQILGLILSDVVDVVKEPLSKLIGWEPLRNLVSNLLGQVGELLKDPAALIRAFQRGGRPAMELLLPKLEKVVGPFADAVLVRPLAPGLGKDILKAIIDAARSFLARPQDKLFRYLEMRDGKNLVKCILDDFAPRLLSPLPDALKAILRAGIDQIAEAALKDATCPGGSR